MRRAGLIAARARRARRRRRAVARAESARPALRRSSLRAADARPPASTAAPRAPFIYPVSGSSAVSSGASRRIATQPGAAAMVHRRPAGDRGRAAGGPLLLLGADGFGRDIVLAPALRRARLARARRRSPRVARDADRRARRRHRRLRGRRDRRAALAHVTDFVLVLPAIYVALALRAVMPLVLPASTVFVLLAGDLRAARLADRRARRARHRRVRARARLRDRRPRARRRAVRACCCATCCPRRAATSWCRRRCCCRRSSSPRPRCRTSASGFPTRADVGHDAAGRGERGAARRAPWMLAPAAAIFVVVLAVNLAVQGGGRAPVQLEP